MAYVSMVRRMTSSRDWPLFAGPLLGVLAVLEIVVRGGPGESQVSGVLLGLAATVPLALARTEVVAAAVALTLANGVTLLPSQRPTVAGLVALVAAAYLAGRYALGRLRRGAAERAASARLAQETLLAHAAQGERARIARELHDVVAHHISMIAVHAETARLTTPGLPPAGATRLRAIADTARLALTEMRRLLGVLREDAGEEPTRAPQPGLAQLVALVDEARESTGVSTRLIVRGEVGVREPGVELTAYRIVQEALTNARRHAPGAAVDVELEYGADAVWVRVRDNGPGRPDAAGGGHGLLGMRERIAAVGGELWVGPGQASGFLVTARLPATRQEAVG